MSLLFDSIAAMPSHGDKPAIVQLDAAGDTVATVSYSSLYRSAASLAHALGEFVLQGECVGLVAANSAAWVQADLALLMGRQVEVPVPLGFSAEQAEHLLSSCRLILVDGPGRRQLEVWQGAMPEAGFSSLPWLDIESVMPTQDEPPQRSMQGDWVCKVIHTSGTTSKPKGVRIRAEAIDTVLTSLRGLTQDGDYARYLNLVPFSLLLEQITALYLPYTQQGCVLLAPAGQPPLGEAGASIEAKLQLMSRAAPSAMTLTPAMVEAINAQAGELEGVPLVDTCRALFGRATPPLLAAGGAPVSRTTLAALSQRGIEVFVGYGLSENSSVACWNARGANRIGTVGKPLAHVECKLSAEGELGIRSQAVFAGYAGSDPSACAVDEDGWLWTGDLATIDADGYVSVVGRKKNLIITSHGRNVSPEFVEASYRQVSGVKEIVILGEQREALSAFVVAHQGCDTDELAERLAEFGRTRLSDVERVVDLICLPENAELLSDLFTVTGRPRREAIESYVQTLKKQ
jgi:long-subunit acyl-CoA synthetase (AMP-forming)